MGLLRKILEWKLRKLAEMVLRKYQPKIIGVTGSVGKTSTKDAIYSILKTKYRVRRNEKNYNNELGVPLTILGMETGNKNPFAWLMILCRALRMAWFIQRDYPEYLVLEMGADKPGDIEYLVTLAPCTVGVVTAVGHVHTEFFGSLEKVAREKQFVVSHLRSDGIAVLNAEDDIVMRMQKRTKARVITYGFAGDPDVRATEFDLSTGRSSDASAEGQIKGVSFKVQYDGSTVPFFLPSILGKHQVYSVLAAICVGVSLGINLAECSKALKTFATPPGRMRLLPGIKRTSLIDDTYNSSPMAAIAALRVLDKVDIEGRKFAVFGDMLELGNYTEEGHRQVGLTASELVDVLIAVGERAKIIANAAKEAGMSEDRVFRFSNTEEAGRFIQRRIKEGDIILVKGSQGARMERVVKEIMAEPLKAPELLVRQGPEWQDR